MRIRNAPGRCSGIWQKSAAELSDAELLAILLGPGPAGGRAMHIAREALLEWGGIRGVFAHSKELARSTKGVGTAGVARLEAARELVLRQLRAELQGKTILSGSAEAKQYLQARYGGDPHESFVCVYLNNKHHVVNIEVLFRGTIDGAPVYPREVVKRCLYFNAAAVIFAHNHPSGAAEPSEADITVTRRLQAALNTVDIRVLDHLVLAEQDVVSLAERRLMV